VAHAVAGLGGIAGARGGAALVGALRIRGAGHVDAVARLVEIARATGRTAGCPGVRRRGLVVGVTLAVVHLAAAGDALGGVGRRTVLSACANAPGRGESTRKGSLAVRYFATSHAPCDVPNGPKHAVVSARRRWRAPRRSLPGA